MKEYNVWVCVEEIDEEKGEDGKDIEVWKIAKYKDKEKAIAFGFDLQKYNDTDRDSNGFTID